MNAHPIIWILLLVAFGFICFGVRLLFIMGRISKTGIEAEGTVVGINIESSSDSSSNLFYPLIKFSTNKSSITKASNLGVFPGVYKLGMKVIVVYNSENPEKFFIKDTITQLLPKVMIAVGLALIMVALFL